ILERTYAVTCEPAHDRTQVEARARQLAAGREQPTDRALAPRAHDVARARECVPALDQIREAASRSDAIDRELRVPRHALRHRSRDDRGEALARRDALRDPIDQRTLTIFGDLACDAQQIARTLAEDRGHAPTHARRSQTGAGALVERVLLELHVDHRVEGA